jgi:outer membrane protein TolC
MVRAAQRGYGEGERTVTELVDAQRAQTEVALRRLELIALAKRAEVDLRSATGELK